MGIDVSQWRSHLFERSDMVSRVTHLTRGKDDDEAFINLWKILTDKTIIASGNEGYICGDNTATCFQELPLNAIVENLAYESKNQLDNKHYSWFGIRVNKGSLFQKGGCPVIYGKTQQLKEMLPSSEYWRIVNLDLSDPSNIIDWTHEREWRIKGNFEFEYDDIEVLVRNGDYYRKFIKLCQETNHEDILSGIHGIIPLNSICY